MGIESGLTMTSVLEHGFAMVQTDCRWVTELGRQLWRPEAGSAEAHEAAFLPIGRSRARQPSTVMAIDDVRTEDVVTRYRSQRVFCRAARVG